MKRPSLMFILFVAACSPEPEPKTLYMSCERKSFHLAVETESRKLHDFRSLIIRTDQNGKVSEFRSEYDCDERTRAIEETEMSYTFTCKDQRGLVRTFEFRLNRITGKYDLAIWDGAKKNLTSIETGRCQAVERIL